MGWQSRLPKDQKPEFNRTCNKCAGTGVKKTFVSIGGSPQAIPVKWECKCQAPPLSKEIVVRVPTI
jgi:hypothetical protein